MNKLLEVKELTYRKNLKNILDNVNLDVDSGKIIALLGENGAGKTTLMRVIVGIAKHYQGEVIFEGKNVADLKSRADKPPSAKLTINKTG